MIVLWKEYGQKTKTKTHLSYKNSNMNILYYEEANFLLFDIRTLVFFIWKYTLKTQWPANNNKNDTKEIFKISQFVITLWLLLIDYITRNFLNYVNYNSDKHSVKKALVNILLWKKAISALKNSTRNIY